MWGIQNVFLFIQLWKILLHFPFDLGFQKKEFFELLLDEDQELVVYLNIMCTWAHDVQLHIAGTNEPKSAQQAKQRA